MDSLVEGVTGHLVEKSLDMALVRHQVIANNIANANTSGFRPLVVQFEEEMQKIYSQFRNHNDKEGLKSALNRVSNETSIGENEEYTKVLLDREVTNMARNTLNYQALLTARGQLGILLKLAINGGRK